MKIKITGGKIDIKSINKKIGKSAAFQNATRDIIDKKFNRAKSMLMEEFDSHPVTKEIASGPAGSNVSGTLAGYGNLFSFIGFDSSTDPTQAVRNFLQAFIVVKPVPGNRGVVKEFVVNVPSVDEFNFAKMPWESGNNWVRAIEVGVSGFNYFMNKAHASSRSGAGIQIDSKIRATNSKGVPYMTQILNKFKQRLLKQ